MHRRKPAFKAVAAALFFALCTTGCPKKSDDTKTGPGKGNGVAANGNGHSSGPWKGKMTTVVGGVKDLLQLVESHRGKVVVLDLWTTWCGPCKKELPGLAQLQKTHGDKIVCIAVNLEYDGNADSKSEAKKNEVESTVRKRFGTVLKEGESLNPEFRLFISNEVDETFGPAIGHIDGLPVIFVYSKSGKRTKIDIDYAKKHKGKDPSYEKHINPLVEKLLKEPAPKSDPPKDN